MKTKTVTLLMTIFIVAQSFGQKAIFLHHSTGGGVYYEGQVSDKIEAYNTQHSTSYQIDEFSYPDSPYPWENYPYDFWNLWVNGRCQSDTAGIECLETILGRYDVVIFKHCYPGANIDEDGTPDISSSNKTLANYKLQYKALLSKFDQYPNKKFVVWTLAPQHRNATNTDQAIRAGEFVNWVKNDWLTEGGNQHPNVFVFDFFGIVAESNPSPANGQQNCLKYEYEVDHDGSDGHPNQQANLTAGEAFANFMIQIFSGQEFTSIENQENKICTLSYDTRNKIIAVNNSFSGESLISITGIDGRNYMNKKYNNSANSIDISNLPQGVYIVQLITDTGYRQCLKISTMGL